MVFLKELIMTSWHERLAKEMKIKHSDTLAVIRYGKHAKRATRRRQRRLKKKTINNETS
jgi:hypothetical protein